MPTYEYECKKCSHTFEVFQSMTARPLSKCPECKGKVQRLIGGGAGIIFKGSGFYETDYRSDSYKQAAKKETDSGSSSKSDTPAKPAESKAPAKAAAGG